MAKQLTDSEQEAMEQARREYMPYYAGYEIEEKQGFRGGFIAGLSYNQAKLDSERQERIAHNKQVSDKLNKLISYIKDEIPYAEIEDVSNG